MTGNVLAVCESSDKSPDFNAPLIAKGSELSEALGGKSVALLCGEGVSHDAGSLASKGVDVLVMESLSLKRYNPATYYEAVKMALDRLKPQVVLIGHSFMGMDLGPTVAVQLGVGYVSNCTDVEVNDGRVIFTRPIYRGKLQEKLIMKGAPPYIATIQKDVLIRKSLSDKSKGRVDRLEVAIDEASLRSRVVETIEPKDGGVDLTKAEVIVAGGRGVGAKDNFKVIKELAEALGGSFACSRPLVDVGWFPVAYQVGLSGKTVSPKLYIAAGISGAIEHVTGMRSSKLVVAINKDPSAPIFEVAHYGVVGDVLEILPRLTEEIRKLRGTP